MSSGFLRGQQIGREDLNIYTTNNSGHPTNPAEISYALFDFTTGLEVLVGSAKRVPANPSVGEYYASIIIPLDANLGTYRIRWTMRESVGGPIQTVVQEFEVGDRTQAIINRFTQIETNLVSRLRVLLRDNCFSGSEKVELDVNGALEVTSLNWLWLSLRNSEYSTSRIHQAFEKGTLKVRSISPTGTVEWKRVLDAQRTQLSEEALAEESLLEVTTEVGPMVLTAGHRVFTSPTSKTEAENLKVGDRVLGFREGKAEYLKVLSTRKTTPEIYVYDLTAEDWHNFILHESKACVSNSPDRNYRFRPPVHEDTVNQYNKVFGYIWEDAELLEYIERSLDMVIAAPPRTPFGSVDNMVQVRREWTTVLLTGAMVYALQALQINWTAEEFNYSIGGVSLDLDKSSKYESLKSGASELFDKQLEKAKLTVKFIKGLQQSRFGNGVRSSFGPFTGKGVVTPAKFVGV